MPTAPTDGDILENILMRALYGMITVAIFATLEVVQYYLTKLLFT